MAVIPLHAFQDNYIWVFVDEATHTFTCVDPGDAAPVLAYAQMNRLSLAHILLTHHHLDHIGGVPQLKHAFPDARVYAPMDERISDVTNWVRDEDIIHINNHTVRVLSTPGHTKSHISYQEITAGWLFCGDTLFSAGCGRVFDGTILELHHSLNLLKKLPQDTKIFCGHEYTRNNLRFATTVDPDNTVVREYITYLENNETICSLPSTIALEKQINPFFRTDALSIQRAAVKEGLTPLDSLSLFTYLRAKKDNF